MLTDATFWTAVGALAAVLGVLIAGVAAFLALRQLKQGREMSEDQARPYVVVYLEPSAADHSLIDLVISNVGQTLASAVRVMIDPPYEPANAVEGYRFMDARPLSEPIASIPPGFSYRLYMESLPEHAADPSRRAVYTATVNYSDRRGRPQQEIYELDLDATKGAVGVHVHNVHHIAKTLRAWAKKSGVHNY